MKKLYYVWLAGVLVLGLSACSSKEKKHAEEITMMVPEKAEEAKGPQRMQVSDVKNTFTYRGKEYVSTVVRRPDEGLPVVKDRQGDLFVDNRITLRLTCGGKSVVERNFTKESFASLVEADFLEQALLEGLVFDQTTERGMVYAASVAYPQSDLYVPLRLIVSPDGSIVMEKDELMNEYLPEGEEEGR